VDLLAAFRTFVRISETGSFSSVAREIGATQPAISRQIGALETHLGVRLLQRSTRRLTLTEDGRDFVARARAVLEAVDETEAAISRRRQSPSGLVRLGCPAIFGRTYIVPHIGRLLDRYPELSVEIVASDDVVDMIQERLDITIRVGDVADSTLVARRIGSTISLPVASTEYLAEHGEPTHPRELASHACLIMTRRQRPGEWSFTGPDGPIVVQVGGRLRANSVEAILAAVIAGQGIAQVPLWMLREPIREGVVKPLLSDWKPRASPISAVYPSRRFLPPRTRAVIDYLVQEFRLDPLISLYGEA
jgi:DNA-binding transcriptional LysR family regulator